MTDMIERMTHVLMCAGITRDSGESIRLYRPDECAALASRALSAALDPEDEALVEAVARGMCNELGLHADDWTEDLAGKRKYVWEKERETAREAIAALRSYTTQGE